MDTAVGLVEAYLRVNGYFTVAEYPVLEVAPGGGFQTATDLDVLAIRFPGAGRRLAGQDEGGPAYRFEPDPALRSPADRADMVIGEVKEGPARLNPAIRDPEILGVALARFGCCPPAEAPRAARSLVRRGYASMPDGHRARIVAFGTGGGSPRKPVDTVIDLGHVIRFLGEYFRERWEVLRHAQFKDPVLSLLMLFEKAGVGAAGPAGPPG